MDKMIDNPWFLRMVAFALAMLLFFTVKSGIENENLNNTGGTTIDALRNVPVEVYYDENNLVVTGIPETVTVNIEGPSSLILSTKAMNDYKVFVDLRELPIGEHRVAISHENLPEKLNVTIDPFYIDVIIEEKMSKKIDVEPDMNESMIDKNYVVKSYDVNPKVVTITGAKSIVESISYVKATIVTEEGISDSFEQQANIRVLDRELNKLDVLIEPATAQVQVKVEEYSREVSLSLRPSGTPKKGVSINNLSTDVEKIRLFGPSAIVDKIEKLVVDVDVSKLEKSGEFDVELAIPEGVTKLSLEKIKVNGNLTTEDETTMKELSEE